MAYNRKAIPKEHEWDYQEEFIEDYEYEGVTCRYFPAARYDTALHRQKRAWQSGWTSSKIAPSTVQIT
jgi:hypothetical protein